MAPSANAATCVGIRLVATGESTHAAALSLQSEQGSTILNHPQQSTHTCNGLYEEILAANAPQFYRSRTAMSVGPSSAGSSGCHDGSPVFCSVGISFDNPVCPNGREWMDGVCVSSSDQSNEQREAGQSESCEVPRSPNPIYFGSGNKLLSAESYRGTGTMPMVWQRTYNSLDSIWRFSFSQHLIFDNPIQTTLRRADGKGLTFYSVAGAWESLSDVKTVLSFDVALDEWTVKHANDTVEVFDSDGDLLSITNRAGQAVTLVYASDLLSSITHYSGRTLMLTHDANDRVTSMTDPDGNEYRYEYNVNGLLEFVIYPDDTTGDPNDNPRIQYHYEDVNDDALVTGMTDELSERYATYAYDIAGNATLSELAGGVESTAVSYGANNVNTVTNELGKLAIYTFTINKGVRKVTQVDGQPTAMCGAMTSAVSYDANGYVDTRTDENGNVTDFTYNDRGLVESRTDALNTAEARTTTRVWHATLRVPTQIIRPGQTVDMTYDAVGRLLTRTVTDTQTQSIPYSTNGNVRTTTYTYESAFGLVASIDGPRSGDTATFTYDANGDLETTTNALGHVTTILTRDARGLPLRIEDANGVVTELAYDARGSLLTRTVESSQGNAITTFVYDDAQQLLSVTLPNLSVLSYEYDDAHRMDAIENNLGERIEYTLDNAGNRTAELTRDGTSAIVRSMTRLYDELSRLREDIGAQNQTTSYLYDDNDNLSDVEDALLNTTTQAFDALDRLITVTDPLLNDADYDYDDRDNLTQVTDPRGIITSFVYDGLNNLIQEASADAGTRVHLYDAGGNRTQTTDARGVISQLSYDGLSRITAVTYPASTTENITYVYDTGTNGLGRLASLSDVSGSTAYTYDDRGNVLTESRVIGVAPYTTSYTYDLADNLTSTTYSSGRVVTYALDTLGRVDGVTTQTDAGSSAESVASGISYLPFGPSDGWTYGNGSVAARAFDQDYRMTDLQVTTSGSAGQLDRDYLYSAVNNITGITNVLDTTRSQTFGYDVLYRLTQAIGVYGTYDFDYDEVGNRTIKTIDSTLTQTYTYEPTSNRLSSVNDAGDLRVFSYDAAGNLILDDRGSGPGVTSTYNDRNRLIQVEVAQ